MSTMRNINHDNTNNTNNHNKRWVFSESKHDFFRPTDYATRKEAIEASKREIDPNLNDFYIATLNPKTKTPETIERIILTQKLREEIRDIQQRPYRMEGT